MKIIYLVSHAAVAGPINQALNILTGLKLLGKIESKLVTMQPESKQSWLYRYENNGIDYVQLNPHRKASIKTCARQLNQYIKDNNVNVIHASGFSACFVALLGHGSAKVVITQRCYPNELAEELPKLVRPIVNRLYLWIIKRVDAVVACSYSMQMAFKKQVGLNFKVVQNGVNTSYFKPVSVEQKRTLREELGLPIDKKFFLVLGVLLERKNNVLIVEAFNKIANSDSVCVFVGGGPQETILRNKALNNDNILFVGSTTRPIEYLQAADVLISSSLAEGLPNTVLEALACGLPSILSDIDPHKELVEGTSAGVLFKNNDVNDLCRAILNTSGWDMLQMSKEARQIAENKFSLLSLAKKYECIYQETIK